MQWILPARLVGRLAAALVAVQLTLPTRAAAIERRADQDGGRPSTGAPANAGSESFEQVTLSLPATANPVASFSRLPLSFVPNEGQADPATKFEVRGRGYLLSLEQTEVVMALPDVPRDAERPGGRPATLSAAPAMNVDTDSRAAEVRRTPRPVGASTPGFPLLRMRLVGANTDALITGEDELPGKFHYFIGNDPALWRTNIPGFAKVRYRAVYTGIDLVYYGNDGQLEYDFVVGPGAHAENIQLAIEGADAVKVDDRGDLRLAVADQELHWRKPKIYQEIDGVRVPVAGDYVLQPRTSAGDGAAVWQVAFRVAPYDRMLALVIDPVLAYSTYLGGGFGDMVFAIAVDSEGSAYFTGRTHSSTAAGSRFPTTVGALQRSFPGTVQDAAFITKLSPSGDRMIYSTVLSGTKAAGAWAGTEGHAIAIDSAGRAVIAGHTSDADLPAVNAFQPEHAGGNTDLFVAKLNQDGSGLVFSSYLGGSMEDMGSISGWGGPRVTMSVDGAGDIHLTGQTQSSDFPLAQALQSTFESEWTGIIAKVAADGSRLLYSTFLPPDLVTGTPQLCVAADPAGRAYVAGYILERVGGDIVASDAFLFRLNPSGSALDFIKSGVIGAPAYVSAIAVDGAGGVLLAGSTRSPNLPSTPGALQPSFGGGDKDGFLARFNPSTPRLEYLTYLGGEDVDEVTSLAVDSAGNVYAGGWTGSPDFPVKEAIQSRIGRGLPPVGWWDHDAFLLKLSPDGQRLHWSTFLGGGKGPSAGDPGSDRAYALALGLEGSVYLGGSTESRDFPVMTPLQPTLTLHPLAGGLDGFIAKIVDVPPTPAAVQITRSGNTVSISWPASASGYALEFTEVLDPTPDWQLVPTPAVVVGGQHVVTLEIGFGPLFFRLKKP